MFDEYWAKWGVCNMMFPRCLLGFELQLCQSTCLGSLVVTFCCLEANESFCENSFVKSIRLCYITCGFFAEGVREGCHGESRDYLEKLCMRLPNERCLPAPDSSSMCEEHEFDCGDGKCIRGLGICDNKYQCMTGADETMWYVAFIAFIEQ
jgi:hypothetical protein